MDAILSELVHPTAEATTLSAMRDDIHTAISLAEILEPSDYATPRHSLIFEAISRLVKGIEPIDTPAIVAECKAINQERAAAKRPVIPITPQFVESLHGHADRAVAYAHTLQRLAWLRRMGSFAHWLVEELSARPQPDELFTAAQEKWTELQPVRQDSHFVYGWDTIPLQRDTIAERIKEYGLPKDEQAPRFDWPWDSWNQRIRPLRRAMVGIIAAADGMGKTAYLEQIAEHWAKSFQVVYVHLEDSLDYKLDRRTARHTGIEYDKIEDGNLSPDLWRVIEESHERLADQFGRLHYYHAAGKSMTEIVQELETRVAEGVCDCVVFDYLDKVQPTRGQAHLYADNTWERQAHDMETLKTFAEKANIPIFTATQGNKDMQGAGPKTRRQIQGSGQKSQKSQLVIILSRDLVGPGGLSDKTGKLVAEEGEYSPLINVRIDKQNRGKTGNFQQYIVGQFFRIKDIERRNTQ